jgi:hypothetical protein
LRDSLDELFPIYQMICDISLEYDLFSPLYTDMENLDKIHGSMLKWLGLKDERKKYVRFPVLTRGLKDI